MTQVVQWIKSEWKDPSTHTWLLALGATATAWLNGAMTNQQAVAAVVLSTLAIIIPTGAQK